MVITIYTVVSSRSGKMAATHLRALIFTDRCEECTASLHTPGTASCSSCCEVNSGKNKVACCSRKEYLEREKIKIKITDRALKAFN
jgi:hypothetical protein